MARKKKASIRKTQNAETAIKPQVLVNTDDTIVQQPVAQLVDQPTGYAEFLIELKSPIGSPQF